MKTFNFKSWVKSPRVQKWGLFGLLAATLGFNLSMNPEHFNNIARHERPEVFQSNELASNDAPTTPEAKAVPDAPKVPPTAPVAVPADKVATVQKVYTYVGLGPNKDKTYTANVVDAVKSDGSKISFAEVTGTFCITCDKPETLTFPLTAGIQDLSKEILAQINTKIEIPDKAATAEKVAAKVEKAGERTTADLEALAKKCDDKLGKESIISCHKTTLIALSKDLKNTSDTEDLVTTYFKDNLKLLLERGFKEPTVDLSTRMFDRIKNEGLELSYEVAEQLLAGLRGKNGRGVLQMLPKLMEQSVRAQVINAQKIVDEGIRNQNPSMVFYGQSLMQQGLIEPQVRQIYQNMSNAIEGNRGISEGDKGIYQRYAEGSFFRPAQNLMYRVRALNQLPIKSGQMLTNNPYSQFRIDPSGIESIDGFQNNSSLLGLGIRDFGSPGLGERWRQRRLDYPEQYSALTDYSSTNRLLYSPSTTANCNYSNLNPTQYAQRQLYQNQCGSNYLGRTGSFGRGL